MRCTLTDPIQINTHSNCFDKICLITTAVKVEQQYQHPIMHIDHYENSP